MATFRDKVVTVTLNYGASSISETQFDIPLIFVGHNATANLTDVFTSSDDILSAGFSTSSAAYKMAVLLFDGLLAPDEVIIGKRSIDSQVFTPVVDDHTEYSVTLKSGSSSKEFSFTSDDSATAEEIVVGLSELINADTTWGVKVSVSEADGELIVSTVDGVYVDIAYSDTLTLEIKYSNNILEDIAAVAEEDNTWFYLLSDSHAAADVEDLAGYVEEYDKVYFFSSQDTAIADDEDGNLLATLNDSGYINTCFALWMSDADTVFPEAAVVGAICSATPGTTTLHGKTLTGVTLEKLSTTRETNIVTMNGNIYRKEHGSLFYRDGFMVNGYYVDYVIHALWFKARLDESLFSLFKTQSMLGSGVRATSTGIAQVRSAVTENPIQVGINNGSIANETITSDDTGMYVSLKPTIYIPSRADMTTSQINNRIIEGMIVEYVYAGFFHYVKVQVNVLTNRTSSSSTSSSSNSTSTSS